MNQHHDDILYLLSLAMILGAILVVMFWAAGSSTAEKIGLVALGVFLACLKDLWQWKWRKKRDDTH